MILRLNLKIYDWLIDISIFYFVLALENSWTVRSIWFWFAWVETFFNLVGVFIPFKIFFVYKTKSVQAYMSFSSNIGFQFYQKSKGVSLKVKYLKSSIINLISVLQLPNLPIIFSTERTKKTGLWSKYIY